MNEIKNGTLYLVATPIGNLDDITIRARNILGGVDRILAEDTRLSRRLLDHLGITKPLSSYHDHNERQLAPRLAAEIAAGASIALITDAGTPGIADPAFVLVREAIQAGASVVPIPGACAVICAISASGLPTDRFVFENFPPVKQKRRIELFERLKEETRTVILYESPYRIERMLEDLAHVMNDVHVVIARELTKIHEEFLRGTPGELLEHFRNKQARGEMVVMFNPRIRKEDADQNTNPSESRSGEKSILSNRNA